ncbi:MAG: asparagine synthase (glutamine-hydrolyzing), partial [Candidatus Eisenbacteria bacterium]|nr:asparagine synthase (glutamine-hydrolyzing) [Candidatus Eisenbacteria bacterium]
MCGIAGIYRFGDLGAAESARDEDRALVGRMLRKLEHRGPDDEGLESVGRVTLGVRRLSILDVLGGHQPIADAERRVWAIQNGELYNFPELRADLATRHPLRTRTDTELLPYLWLEHGPAAIERLRGMFATAIYDTRAQSLMLARDPLGVKPLYAAHLGDRLLFASEIKALLCESALPRTLDREAVERYLALGFVAGERTALHAVRKVRPGCRVLLTPEGRKDERYWPWPRFFNAAGAHDPGGARDPHALATEAGRRIAASTESMLLSDRPVGILLSGGVDSSVMVGLLPEAIRRETRTFSIGFEGAGYHDERAVARRVAEFFGTRHREFSVPLDVRAELPRIIAMLDEPCADAAIVPAHLVARAASQEVTVLLSGTGGDEVFGGYRRYRLPALMRKLGWMPPGLARVGASWLGELDHHRRSLSGERAIMVRKLLEARGRGTPLASYLS